MPRKCIDRTTVVGIDLDSLDSAFQQKLGKLLWMGVLSHAIDRPSVHGVIDDQLFLSLTAEQLINRHPGCLAENVPLGNVDGGQHAGVGTAPWLVRNSIKDV